MTRPPSGEQWHLRAGGAEAVVVEVGGGLRSYTVDGRELVDGWGLDERAPSGAGQVLAPWPNRIRAGRWGDGQQLALTQPSEGCAIHGLTRWAAWQPLAVAADAVTLGCALDPQPGWPGSLALRTTWSVDAGGLHATHDAENVGATTVPFGLGVHPYLIVPGVAVDDLVVTVPAASWAAVDAAQIPTGIHPVDAGHDFAGGQRIGPRHLDQPFTDLARDAAGDAVVRVAGPDGAGVELVLGPAFGWVQVFTGDTVPAPRTRRSVACEPMTCPADAFNSGTGVVTLAPGDTWTGSWSLRPVPAGR